VKSITRSGQFFQFVNDGPAAAGGGVGLDRCGWWPFLLAGLAGYGVAMFIFAYSDQVWTITLARVCQGIASALL
jgi:MFS family permease